MSSSPAPKAVSIGCRNDLSAWIPVSYHPVLALGGFSRRLGDFLRDTAYGGALNDAFEKEASVKLRIAWRRGVPNLSEIVRRVFLTGRSDPL